MNHESSATRNAAGVNVVAATTIGGFSSGARDGQAFISGSVANCPPRMGLLGASSQF